MDADTFIEAVAHNKELKMTTLLAICALALPANAADYANEHTMFSAQLQQACGLDVAIIRNGLYQVQQGIGSPPSYRVQCPSRAVRHLTFTPPEHHSPIIGYEIELDGFYPGVIKVRVKTCDASGCGAYSEVVESEVE